jgi:hypothetical protein
MILKVILVWMLLQFALVWSLKCWGWHDERDS